MSRCATNCWPRASAEAGALHHGKSLNKKNPGVEARRRGFVNDRRKGERGDQSTGLDDGAAVVEFVLLAEKNPGAEARRRGFMNDRWKGERSDQFTGVDDGAAIVEVVFL